MNDPFAAWSAPTQQLPLAPLPDEPVVWASLDEDATSHAMRELDRWVSWLVERYHLDARVVLPCWAEHGELVEELSALRGAWYAAFAPTQSGEDALRWHADFGIARERLSEWVARTGCRVAQHRDPDGPNH